MLQPMRESDWKVFRELHAVALERFCGRVLPEIAGIAADGRKTGHERYLGVYKLLKRRDEELADTFNDPRRSRALYQLAGIVSHGLLSEEELARFSRETREAVQLLAGLEEGEPAR